MAFSSKQFYFLLFFLFPLIFQKLMPREDKTYSEEPNSHHENSITNWKMCKRLANKQYGNFQGKHKRRSNGAARNVRAAIGNCDPGAELQQLFARVVPVHNHLNEAQAIFLRPGRGLNRLREFLLAADLQDEQ